jgi:plastocyanin
MRSPVVRLALAALLVFVAVWVAACSKSSDKGTNPPPPGSELNSGNLGGGVVFQHTFASAGSFPYKCTNHPVMTGTVTVSASSANDSAFVAIVNMTSTGFSPQSVTIKPGGHVRWLNNLGQPAHTVTSN